MADKIICIREYASGPEAYMALDKLVNEGDSGVGHRRPLHPLCTRPAPAGGYRLLVFEKDAERAAAILGDD